MSSSYGYRLAISLGAAVALSALVAAAPPPAEGLPAGRDCHGDPLPPHAVARLGTVAFRTGTLYECLAFAPDGTLATGGIGSLSVPIRLWNPRTGREVRQLTGHRSTIYALQFSPDGAALLSASFDASIRLWDLKTGQAQVLLGGMRITPLHVAWSADLKRFLTGNLEGSVALRDVQGAVLRTLVAPKGPRILAVALSADGKTAAVRSANQTVQLWDANTGEKQHALAAPGPADAHPIATGRALIFSPDGKHLAIGQLDRGVGLWDVATGKQIHHLTDPRSGIWTATKLAFSPDGRHLACAGNELSLRVWGVTSGQEIRHVPRITREMHDLAFAPDGQTLAYDTQAATLNLLDLTSSGDRVPSAGHRGSIPSLAFLADGASVVTGSSDGTVRFWETASGREMRRLAFVEPDGFNQVGAVAVSRDSQTVTVIGHHSPLHIWQGQAAQARIVPLAGMSVSRARILSADGRYILAASASPIDADLGLWDAATGQAISRWNRPRGAEHGIALAPDGRYVATDHLDRPAQLWETSTGRLLQQFSAERSKQIRTPMTFSPDGRMVAVVKGSVELWEVATGQLRRSYPRNPNPDAPTPVTREIRTLTLGPRGRLLALGRADGTIDVYDLASGRTAPTLSGHRGAVQRLAFSPDETRLASSSVDTTGLIWDISSLDLPRPEPLAPLTPVERERLWTVLRSATASEAFPVITRLTQAPTAAVELLQDHLRPAQAIDIQRVTRLIAALDDDSFEVRERAIRELTELGLQAEGELQKALQARPSLEVRRRLEQVLQKNSAAQTEKLRTLRALEVLERIATVEARKLLERLAGGDGNSWLTQEAQAVLRRLPVAGS